MAALAIGVVLWLWTGDLTIAGLSFGGLTVLVTAFHLAHILRRTYGSGSTRPRRPRS